MNFVEDDQIDEMHNIVHKVDTVYHIKRLVSIETINPDQALIKATTIFIMESVRTRTLKKDTILTIGHETLYKFSIGMIQTNVTETFPMTKHRTILTKERTLTIVTKDPVIILEIETIAINDPETLLNHHIEIIQNIQIDRIKTIEVVHLNINDISIKYNLQAKRLQTNQEGFTCFSDHSEKQVNNLHFESKTKRPIKAYES